MKWNTLQLAVLRAWDMTLRFIWMSDDFPPLYDET